MARRIVFHVGLAKTGTTSFQHLCHAHRRLLRRHGVLYPKSSCGLRKNHSPLAASYLDYRQKDPSVAMRWAPRETAVRKLVAEIEAADAPTTLISSEHFSTHFVHYDAVRLAEDFADYDCAIVIVLRDPHQRFLSSYNTHVTAGGCLPLEDYARAMMVPGTRFMSAKETVWIWQAAFGADRIRIIDYDATGDVVEPILRLCGFEGRLPDGDTSRRRVSFGADAVEALRCANQAIRARQGVPAEASLAAWLQLALFSILCRVHIAKCESTRGRWRLGAETLAALDAIAASDREAIARDYGVALRGDAAREQILEAEPAPPSEARMLLARALLDRVAWGMWAPSQWLVGLATRLAKARAPRRRAAD